MALMIAWRDVLHGERQQLHLKFGTAIQMQVTAEVTIFRFLESYAAPPGASVEILCYLPVLYF